LIHLRRTSHDWLSNGARHILRVLVAREEFGARGAVRPIVVVAAQRRAGHLGTVEAAPAGQKFETRSSILIFSNGMNASVLECQ